MQKPYSLAALLGAEEFGFATGPLISIGCVMMRVCNLDTCPVGIATQNPELRKRFAGKPEYVVNFMRFIAQELREYMAKLGVKTVDELVGRTDFLEAREDVEGSGRASKVDLSNILNNPYVKEASSIKYDKKNVYDFELEKTVDEKILIKKLSDAMDKKQKRSVEVDVKNTGDVAGKDVVQLYTSVPYTDYDVENKVEKSAVQLLDYEKTDMIEPGESQTVTITADAQDMASWDSSCENEAGTTGNWILDNGTYYFTVGNGAHEAVNNVLAAQDQDVEGNKDNVQTWELGDFDSSSFAVTLNGTPVENQLQDADLNNWMEDTVTYLSRNDWEGTWPETYKDLTATDEMISTMADDYSDIEANGDPSSVTFGADNGMTLANMKGVEDITDER